MEKTNSNIGRFKIGGESTLRPRFMNRNLSFYRKDSDQEKEPPFKSSAYNSRLSLITGNNKSDKNDLQNSEEKIERERSRMYDKPTKKTKKA